jgi:hypothetical protein
MTKAQRLFAALALLLACAASASAQEWKTAKYSGLEFEVPRDFRTTSGTGPGHLASGGSYQNFTLRYLTAANFDRYIFASSGYGTVIISPNYEGDMDDLASESLSSILSNLTIPGVGLMYIDLANAKVSKYKTMGIEVSETKAMSAATRREYRVYFALAFREAGRGRARMVYMITGCPEDDIEDNNQVMSTILSSFKEPS